MKLKAGMAVAALTIALLAPAAAQAGRFERGMAKNVRIDVTSTKGHVDLLDETISNHLVNLIKKAEPFSNIHTNVYQVEAGDPVLAALREAKEQRHVNVWVTYDGGDDPETNTPPDGAFNWVNLNTPNGEKRMQECLWGCHNNTNRTGKAHSKYFLFDKTRREYATGQFGGLEHAVWIGSANLTRGSGSRAANLATTFWGDPVMHRRMYEVWKDGFDLAPINGDYYMPEHLGWDHRNSGVAYSSEAASVAHISPDDDGPDMWATQLSKATASTGCVLRVLMAQIVDIPAANGQQARARDSVHQVRRIADRGCAVRVIVGEVGGGDTSAALGDEAKKLLCNQPTLALKKRPRMHDKGASYKGTYEGVQGRWQTWSGSHNWTENALRDNDEVLLRVAEAVPDASNSPDAYDFFTNHFWDVWYSGGTSDVAC